MTPTHNGALQIVRESLAFLRASVADLPEAAMEWKPLPTASTVSVLVVHAITSTRFFLRAGTGVTVSITEYRANDRARAFRTTGVPKDDLLAMIDAFSSEAESILAGGAEDLGEPLAVGLGGRRGMAPQRSWRRSRTFGSMSATFNSCTTSGWRRTPSERADPKS